MSDETNAVAANDGFDFDVPTDVQPVGGLEDQFPAGHTVAMRFAFVGCGQGGGKLAAAFYRLGYRRCCAVNTTPQDMSELPFGAAAKLALGTAGAGKDPEVAAAAIADRSEDVYDLLKRAIGANVDRIFVCFGAGGGTGAGIFGAVVETANRYLADCGKPAKVGVIVALPKNPEGAKAAKNALSVVKKIDAMRNRKDLALSPIVLLDNDRIEALYPRLPVAKFFDTANDSIARLLHTFNRLASQTSNHTTFDPADFSVLLNSGIVAFGAQRVSKFEEEADISQAIRVQLKATVLAPVEIKTGNKAALIFMLGEDIFHAVPEVLLDHGFEMLGRVLASPSTLFRGVYSCPGNSFTVFSLIGQLSWPTDRVDELKRRAM